MSSVAFMRTRRNEGEDISLNNLDISTRLDDNNIPRLIAEYFLQQTALDEWETATTADGVLLPHQQPFLWSKEREAFLDQYGRLKLPRLVTHVGPNARHN